jgi:hypothetical protein
LFLLQELVERERLLDENKEAIELKLVEVHNEKSHVTYLLDQSLVKLQLELQEMNSVRKITRNESSDVLINFY